MSESADARWFARRRAFSCLQPCRIRLVQLSGSTARSPPPGAQSDRLGAGQLQSPCLPGPLGGQPPLAIPRHRREFGRRRGVTVPAAWRRSTGQWARRSENRITCLVVADVTVMRILSDNGSAHKMR